MNNDEHEIHRLQRELEQLKREREAEKKSMYVMLFLAIWILPLFGIGLVKDDLPITTGPSMWGIWFFGVPLVTFIYRKIIL